MSKISLSFVNHYFNEIEQTSQNIDKIKLIKEYNIQEIEDASETKKHS